MPIIINITPSSNRHFLTSKLPSAQMLSDAISKHPLFFNSKHEAQISMKRSSKVKKATKNSPDEDPEGYSTILNAPMCNGGFVSQAKPFVSGQLSRR